MNCTETQRDLDGYLDRVLDQARTQRVDEHLAACSPCRRTLEERQALVAAVRTDATYYPAPAALKAWAQSLESAPHATVSAPRPWRALAASLMGSRRGPRAEAEALLAALVRLVTRAGAFAVSLVAAIVTGLAIGSGVTYQLARVAADEARAEAVVASYVRSQLVAGRLTDVASSDRHVVKPWFNGKLDFAPPVRDFTNDGFPLVGGRLDYLGERAVAVLVYRHRQHVINLLVWPASGTADTAVAAVSRQGYTLLHWRHAGMELWLVSDLNEQALTAFSQILRHP